MEKEEHINALDLAFKREDRQLNEMLNTGLKWNDLHYNGLSLMGLAAVFDLVESLDFLLKEGSDPNKSFVDSFSGGHVKLEFYDENNTKCVFSPTLTMTPLMLALATGSMKVAMRLLDHADLSMVDIQGQSALDYACSQKKSNRQLLTTLSNAVKNKQPLSYRDSPLHIAAKEGFVFAVKVLLELGHSAKVLNGNQMSPLMAGLEENSGSEIALLLLPHTSLNEMDAWGRSCFRFASRCGDPRLLTSFIESGVDLNEQDSEGWTILHELVSRGDVSGFKIMIEKGADINLKTNQGQSLLDFALNQREPFFREYLTSVEEGKVLNSEIPNGKTSFKKRL